MRLKQKQKKTPSKPISFPCGAATNKQQQFGILHQHKKQQQQQEKKTVLFSV